MGNCMTCERATSCGSCPWGQECFSCVYGSQEGSHAPDTVCHASASSVGLQIILPLLILLLILSIAYITYRWKRLQRIRSEQQGYNVDLARLEGIYAANAISYSFSNDILPYIMPTDIRACLLFYPLPSKFICTTGFILLVLSAFFIPLGLFTIQSGYNDYIIKDTHHLAGAGMILLIIGSVLCCLFCLVQQLMRKTRQELNNEREQNVLRAAVEAGITVIPAASIAISVAEPMPQPPQMNASPMQQQYQYAPQLPMTQQQQLPPGYGYASVNPYAQPPVAQSPVSPVVGSAHTDYVPLH